MAEAYKHRTVAAPRVAEEVPVVVHHNGGGSHVPRRNHSGSSAKTGLSAAACCRRARSSSSSSSRRRERSCCSCLLPLFSRKRTRHFSALVLLVLAGTFSLRGWRAAMMIDSTALGAGRWSTSSPFGAAKDQRSQCEWESGGPIMFDLRRSKMHADGEVEGQAAACHVGGKTLSFLYYSRSVRLHLGAAMYSLLSPKVYISYLYPLCIIRSPRLHREGVIVSF